MSAPEHRIELAGGWTIWKWACLRSAGFPAHAVLEVATPGAALAAHGALEAEREYHCCEQELRRVLQAAGPLARKQAERRIRGLRSGSAHPSAPPAGPDEVEWTQAQQQALRVHTATQAFEAGWARENRAALARLRSFARDREFRQALLWQNRRALHGGIAALLRKSAQASDFKTRQNEALVANYLQRYAVKNDSIGFFGPVAWASWERCPVPLRAEPGASVIARREVLFEPWAIYALAEALARDPRIRPWCAPRKRPTIRLEGAILHYPVGKQKEIPAVFAQLLARVDGATCARELVAGLCREAGSQIRDEHEGYALLEELAAQRVITWTFELPSGELRPEDRLRQLLEAIGESGLRREALGALDELEAARREIARSAGDEARLDASLAHIEEAFAVRTGVCATRQLAGSHAGRTLVYEECRRDLKMLLGEELRARLGPPLALVLQSARWYTHEIARRYRAHFLRAHEELCGRGGSGRIDYLRFFRAIEAELATDQHASPELVSEVVRELQLRWARLLGLPGSERAVRRGSADLRDAVAREFAAPHPGWPGARFHSPDVMIAAASQEAVRSGDFCFVLGELHAGWNTLSVPVFLEQHPDPQALRAAHARDLPMVRVAPVEPQERATRIFQGLLGPGDLELETGATRSRRPAPLVLRSCELVVARHGDQLAVCTRSGDWQMELIAFLESYLILGSMAHFALVAPAGHSPRVRIDDLVVARERWSFASAELAFVAPESASARYLEVRRWARANDLPRHVFVKGRSEPKPVYVDLESSVFAESLVRLARRSPSFAVTEMLPDLDQAWLPDAKGRTYTSELRLAAVDPEPWRAP